MAIDKAISINKAINKAINIPIFCWWTQLDQAEKVTEELEQLTRHQQLISKAKILLGGFSWWN